MELVPNKNITKFGIILQDIRASLTGQEAIKFSFKDPWQIYDRLGNIVIPDFQA